MSNFGPICRDGFFGNYFKKGTQSVNSSAAAKFKHVKADNIVVRNDFTVCGNVKITTDYGNVTAFCVKEGFANAPGAGGNPVAITDSETNAQMVLEAGERIIGVSGIGTGLAPLGGNTEMTFQVWEDSALSGDMLCDAVMGEELTKIGISTTEMEQWLDGVWGWPDGGAFLSGPTGNVVAYPGIYTNGDDWTAGTVYIKMTTLKIPLC